MKELVKDVCNRRKESESFRIWLKKEHKKYIVECCIVTLQFIMLVFLKVQALYKKYLLIK